MRFPRAAISSFFMVLVGVFAAKLPGSLQTLELPVATVELGLKTHEADLKPWQPQEISQRLQEHLSLLQDQKVVETVGGRLEASGLHSNFMRPYRDRLGAKRTTIEVLVQNSRFVLNDTRSSIVISYQHPDPEVSALVANLYAETFLDFMREAKDRWANAFIINLRNRADEVITNIKRLEAALESSRNNAPDPERNPTLVGSQQTSLEKELQAARQSWDTMTSGRPEIIRLEPELHVVHPASRPSPSSDATSPVISVFIEALVWSVVATGAVYTVGAIASRSRTI